jgi:dGTPase
VTGAERDERRSPIGPDPRTPAQRDRDRILYSATFRRLGGVTQVVLAQEGHLFHNRLTHSIKVAQLGRRMGERIEAVALKKGLHSTVTRLGGLDPDVVEAAGLAHDLGHPPFGHTGEKELQRLARERGLPDTFEGNPQSFRIVTKLELVEGLNLTRATLNAILKYPWPYEEGMLKWGFYMTEQDEFDWAREPVQVEPGERTLEAEIMNWADDITYAVHDLDDFYRGGFIPLHELGREDADLTEVFERVKTHWEVEPSQEPLGDAALEAAARVTLQLVPLSEPFAGTAAEHARLSSFVGGLIGKYVEATGLSERGLEVEPGARVQVALLQELTRKYVLENPALATQRHGEQRILADLFDIYIRALREKALSLLPPRVQEEAEEVMESGEEDSPGAVRVVIDTIARMTESQALRMHQRLTGADLGPLVDLSLM